jgi:hypothetical protein
MSIAGQACFSEIVRLGHPRKTDREHDPKLEKSATGLSCYAQSGEVSAQIITYAVFI